MKPLTEEQRKLVEDYLEWADAISAGYHKVKGLSRGLLDDIICEGRVGLVDASRRWNGTVKFTTYAYKFVRGQITNSGRRMNGSVTCGARKGSCLKANAKHVAYSDKFDGIDMPWEKVDDNICYNKLIEIAKEVLTTKRLNVLKLWLNGKTHKEIGLILFPGSASKQNSWQHLNNIIKILRKMTNNRYRNL